MAARVNEVDGLRPFVGLSRPPVCDLIAGGLIKRSLLSEIDPTIGMRGSVDPVVLRALESFGPVEKVLRDHKRNKN